MEPLSRRKFFRAGAVTVAGVSIGAACVPESAERIPGDLSQMHQHTFEAELGSSFLMASGGSPFSELKLIAVDDLSVRMPEGQRGEVFSAVFLGPKTPALPQDIYRLEHPRLGGFSLMLVPVGSREDGQFLEAVFNRQTL